MAQFYDCANVQSNKNFKLLHFASGRALKRCFPSLNAPCIFRICEEKYSIQTDCYLFNYLLHTCVYFNNIN